MILIVEDEAVARRALQSLLEMSGYRTAAVESAEEALVMLRSRQMEGIALIDVDLPGMNGLDLVREMEQSSPGVIRVLLTASESDRVNEFRSCHDVGFLRKPVNMRQLMDMIEAAPAA